MRIHLQFFNYIYVSRFDNKPGVACVSVHHGEISRRGEKDGGGWQSTRGRGGGGSARHNKLDMHCFLHLHYLLTSTWWLSATLQFSAIKGLMPEHSVVPLADARVSFCSYLLQFKSRPTTSDAGVVGLRLCVSPTPTNRRLAVWTRVILIVIMMTMTKMMTMTMMTSWLPAAAGTCYFLCGPGPTEGSRACAGRHQCKSSRLPDNNCLETQAATSDTRT